MILGGAALAFAVSPAAHAGSCTEPITQVSWTGKVNSGVNVRTKTCMEEGSVVGTISGGSMVSIIGDAHGWYQVKLSDGTIGFVWNSFITVTDKSGAVVETKKVEVKKEVVVKKETSSDLSTRLRGRILLQVEQNGEAWYVHPEDGRRFYMKDGDTAYEMMREFGLGITDADLAKLQAGDAILIEQLKGKILLQVEQHGEAYYIHPETGKAHYLKDGKEAYRIMRELSLGITDADLKKIDADDFEAFKEKKELLREAKQSVIEPSLGGTITLNAETVDGKVMLNWSLSGVDTSKGFKVVYSTFPNPTYENGDPEYLSDGSKRSHTKRIKETGFYHFRICQYTGNGCGLYSNNVSLFVEVPVSGTKTKSEDLKSAGQVPAGVDLGVLNQYWLEQINTLRAAEGLRLLVLDERWKATATEWAVYMGEQDSGTHNRPDGKSMHQWIDTKGLEFTTRHSEGGWVGNYFTENISWGFASSGSTDAVKKVLDDTLAFYLAEASYNGDHYRTIYHADWNSVGLGFHFTPNGNGGYKVYVAMHYGSLVL
jgi:uncharacterized protein YkwD/SH3-like domain-containing protein